MSEREYRAMLRRENQALRCLVYLILKSVGGSITLTKGEIDAFDPRNHGIERVGDSDGNITFKTAERNDDDVTVHH